MDNNTNNWKEFTLGDVQEEHPRRVAGSRCWYCSSWRYWR